jgi:hypothetical protein
MVERRDTDHHIWSAVGTMMYLRTVLLGRASTRFERVIFHGSLVLLRFVGGEVDEGLLSVGDV